MGKRILAAVLILLMLLPCMPAFAAETDYVLRIGGGEIANCLETVDGVPCLRVPVFMDGISDQKLLASATVRIRYDSGYLAYYTNSQERGTFSLYAVDASGRTLGDRSAVVFDKEGTIRIAFASDYGCRIESGKPFLTLYFRFVGMPNSDARLTFALAAATAESLVMAEQQPGDDTDLQPTPRTVGANFAAFTGSLFKEAVHGWKQFDGRWYWFDSQGAAVSGWKQIDGIWYYFLQHGAMTTGWQKIGGSWYYMNASGAMQTGWQQIGGKWYYLNASGAMQTGWQQIGGKWYYFASGGAMQTGWQQIGGKWYYFASGGAMQTGWQQIGGKWFYFNASGVMQTGWQKIGGKWYYFASGGQMQTGWVKLDGKWYWFESSGAMFANGSKTINGKVYNFNAYGVCLNP